MTYYLLPKTSINIHDNISIFADYDPPKIFLSFSLSDYLSKMKEKIDNFSNDWDNMQK